MSASWRLGSGLNDDTPLREALEGLTASERMLRSSMFLDLYGQVSARFNERPCPIVQFVGPEGDEGSGTLAWELAYWVATVGVRNVLFLHANGPPMIMSPPTGRTSAARQTTSPDPSAPTREGEGPGAFGGPARENGAGNGAAAQEREATGRDLTLRETQFEPAMLVERDSGESLLAAWRGQFDLVVIDSPPVAKPTMSLPVAQRVDGVFLVVRAEHTPAAIADAAKRSLEGVGASILGVVYNTNRRL